MSISSVQPGYLTVPTEVGQGPRRTGAHDGAQKAREDRVQLSGTARELAKQYAGEGLTAERIGQLRHDIAEGVYPSPQAIEELAWRLIEAGVV